MQDPKEAENIFKKACQNCDPKNKGFMLLGLGNAYCKRNRVGEAHEIYRQIISQFPNTEPVRIAQKNLEKIACGYPRLPKNGKI